MVSTELRAQLDFSICLAGAEVSKVLSIHAWLLPFLPGPCLETECYTRMRSRNVKLKSHCNHLGRISTS